MRARQHALAWLVVALAAAAHVAAARSSSGTAQDGDWVPTHGPIERLPGHEGPLRSKHYGGYISIGNKQLYYYMVESERDPANDPVV
jgi:serine carboxypeptidase-like clade 1